MALKAVGNVYVIGIPETGGCWISSGRAFFKYADAETVVKKDRESGIDYTRIFPITVYAEKEDE